MILRGWSGTRVEHSAGSSASICWSSGSGTHPLPRHHPYIINVPGGGGAPLGHFRLGHSLEGEITPPCLPNLTDLLKMLIFHMFESPGRRKSDLSCKNDLFWWGGRLRVSKIRLFVFFVVLCADLCTSYVHIYVRLMWRL